MKVEQQTMFTARRSDTGVVSEVLTVPDPAREVRRLGGLGILNCSDIPALDAGCMRVLRLMSDGEWHHPDEIELHAGNGKRARHGLRRMRDLRQFFEIERKKAGPGLFVYRLRPKAGANG